MKSRLGMAVEYVAGSLRCEFDLFVVYAASDVDRYERYSSLLAIITRLRSSHRRGAMQTLAVAGKVRPRA